MSVVWAFWSKLGLKFWVIASAVGIFMANMARITWQRNRYKQQYEVERSNRKWQEAVAKANERVQAKSAARAEKAKEALDAGKMPEHLRNPRDH